MDEVAVAKRVLTDKQYTAWSYDRRGFGIAEIARGMCLDRSTVRDHLAVARAKVAAALGLEASAQPPRNSHREETGITGNG